MSNGSLSRKLRSKVVNSTFSSPGKKFLIPDSFRPHLNSNYNRQAPPKAKDELPSFRWQGASDVPKAKSVTNGDVNALDNTIEYRVSMAAAKELGSSTEPVLQAFCGQTHHPHISSFLNGYVSTSHVNWQQTQLYWDAITDYLPEDVLVGSSVKSARGKLKHRSYSWANSSPKAGSNIRPSTNRTNLGWHMFLFTNPIPARRLLFDGTDSKFLPGPPTVWKYRLWAGGSINLYSLFAPPTETAQVYHQVETPADLRIVGANQTPEKVFLTIRKSFHIIEGTVNSKRYTVPGVIHALKTRPTYNDHNLQIAGPQFEEEYTLCFLRNPPDLYSKGASVKVITPPLQPKFSHTLTPDRHLLFCWSALSYNAHRIHLDPAFAKEEYGAKDLIVHGPLTLILILEWFQRVVAKYAIERELPRFHLRSIDYKNLAPLYVDEPMTLCTKPTKFQTPGTLADSWEVWVQKEVGDGLHSMAFKGTIKLRVELDLTAGRKAGRMMLQPEDPDPPLEEGDEFKSPFF